MKVIFAGTPEFAAHALAALARSRHEIVLVLTRPDRPAGRGLKLTASPVKRLAEERGLPVLQPATLKEAGIQARLAERAPEVMVVAAYGLILPAAVLAIPRLGCINIHASLLPRWRGAAPIQRALLAGDRETGITIMQMDAGLDTGPMLLRAAIPIAEDDTARTLHDRLAALGAESIVHALEALEAGSLKPEPQDQARACYAPKLDKQEATIDWHKPAREIHRAIRAYDPFPGAGTTLDGQLIKLWGARLGENLRGAPGTVLSASGAGIAVACGDGGLVVTELQRAGGRRMPAARFLAGFPLTPGARFGA
ncbi:MAG: methionyl-tRNA formyltransferase [Betaproteobacteria bacterium]|nr:methionyl-tRNA formyltransferase [Betaproteobacteria bacterium]